MVDEFDLYVPVTILDVRLKVQTLISQGKAQHVRDTLRAMDCATLSDLSPTDLDDFYRLLDE